MVNPLSPCTKVCKAPSLLLMKELWWESRMEEETSAFQPWLLSTSRGSTRNHHPLYACSSLSADVPGP